ncbi:hypothetical protein QC762_203500 [Podospora pseudocomata]|uniref:Heme oxygenase n=1 Tax=Podospora pseudocomata TaxID=2093779 RepID=A0ABR0GQN1_9PEZI|nr:hypothetical protein QC762_203500 [Podospora pseudocomata]
MAPDTSPTTSTSPLPHLGNSINAATRTQHTKLNKSILLRLPLSVPPVAYNPTAYLTGLLHMAPIYIAFESAWDKILASHGAALDHPSSSLLVLPENQTLPPFPFGTTADPIGDKKCERVHAVLHHLKISGMARSGSLKRDIRAMSGWDETEVEEMLEQVKNTGRLGEFVRHIHANIARQPEVVIAYAWVLYMALFSGGRFLGSCLEAAGEGFWMRKSDAVLGKICKDPISIRELLASEEEEGDGGGGGDDDDDDGLARIKDDGLPLNFFRFATPLDGEEIKTKFKSRLVELEGLLTAGEREHVVREGVCIFDVMNGIVGQLDGLFDRHPGDDDKMEEENGAVDTWASMLVPRAAMVAGGRLRDSVAVAKERGMRALRKATFSGGERSTLVEEGRSRSHTHRRKSEGNLEGLNTSSSPATAETSTSGLHAHGTITSVTELVEKTSVGKGKATAVEGGEAVKVVRFGEEIALLQQRRNGAKSVTAKAEAVQQDMWTSPKGQCPLARIRRQDRGSVTKVRDARVEGIKNPFTFWSLVLLVALVGFGWGYAYGYITGR